MTLVETILALAVMAIIFAAFLPQFRAIQNSWDSNVGIFETLQNSRLLIDHINKIDSGHYLCAHKTWNEIGYVGILELGSGGIFP